MNVSDRLSSRARNRLPSAIRSLYALEAIDGMISLLSGKPNSETFPIKKLTFDLDAFNDSHTITVEGSELEQALQYGPTAGLPGLVEWTRRLQTRVHHRDANDQDWRISFGVGSQDLLTKALDALLNAGDTILVEDPVYSGIFPSLRSLGARAIAVNSDGQGMQPDSLALLLSQWRSNDETKDLPFPKLMYLTPTGANPSGVTLGSQRRREIFNVIKKYDLFLIEDDAYYFLSFDGLGADPLIRPRPTSFFALDCDNNHVLRLDSFSKVLSSGLRLGFCSGPKVLIDALDTDTAGRNLQPSGVSQAVALSLLRQIGVDGFLKHADRVAAFYKNRLVAFEDSARKHLLANPPAARWETPSAGMFLWIELFLPDGDSLQTIQKDARELRVLALPGSAFSANPDRKNCHVRTSFSQVAAESMDEAFRRLREAVDQAWAKAGKVRDFES